MVQNELNLRLRLAFRHQGRAPSLLILHLSHFEVLSVFLPPALPCKAWVVFPRCLSEPGKRVRAHERAAGKCSFCSQKTVGQSLQNWGVREPESLWGTGVTARRK